MIKNSKQNARARKGLEGLGLFNLEMRWLRRERDGYKTVNDSGRKTTKELPFTLPPCKKQRAPELINKQEIYNK